MSVLFEPTRIGNIEVKNRIVRSATAERMVDKDGIATERLVNLYKLLAGGEIGTIITGHTSVDIRGRAGLQMSSLETDAAIGPLKLVTDTVHKYETRILAQISHCGRYAPGAIIEQRPVAVWLDPNEEQRGQYPPQEAGPADITYLIDAFVKAAVRAQEAGFDGVQIHAAHGYLCSQFLSPMFNRRTDDWGGSVENRARFLIEVIKLIRQRTGSGFHIWAKMNCEDCILRQLEKSDLLPSMVGCNSLHSNSRSIEGGMTVDESIATAKLLKTAGLDALEISGGVTLDTIIRKGIPDKSPARPGEQGEAGEAYFLEQAERFRSALPGFPLALVGGMRSCAVMEKVVSGKGINLVSMSRPFIIDPQFGLKLKKGKTTSTCVSCNLCLGKKGEPVRCRALPKIFPTA
ncbi:MAG: NADH:flavin oxidoreductase [Planctomycetota bacterium]